MENVIKIDNLVKTYSKKGENKTGLTAVGGISFTVQKGEIFGLLGPNGAGKTTTLEIIEGLNTQTSGTVTVLGLDNLKQPDEIKKRIGIQLQSSQYLHHLTLGELLDLFSSLYGKKQMGTDTRTDEHGRKQLLELVNLSDKENAEVKDLSGGQKQRFTIATSLVHNPEILFLDEPTTGLDPKARRDLWELVKTLNRRGITIVLTTHFMEEAEFLCHRVAIMDSGKLLEIDEPRKLIDRLSDTTQISFFTETKLNQEVFSGIPEIKKVYADYPKVILEISSLDKISAIVDLLKTKQIIFYGFTVKTASLEDVYLDLTGKEYEQ
ncbi:MAG: ABC transporter ATP-binding protein [Candidatus Doudnabacteria bacterium]|nr:ABC transporter ATP-binding protein [Candidatus Doudnabacteria bacterium]